jgi:hypothetical protein
LAAVAARSRGVLCRVCGVVALCSAVNAASDSVSHFLMKRSSHSARTGAVSIGNANKATAPTASIRTLVMAFPCGGLWAVPIGPSPNGVNVTALRQACPNSQGNRTGGTGLKGGRVLPHCPATMSAEASSGQGECDMRLILGIILGAAITIGGAYLSDTSSTSPKMVNWDVVAKNFDSVTSMVKQGWTKLTGDKA